MVDFFIISKELWDFNGFLYGVNLTFRAAPQPAVTCSKLTIEILEQGVKYVQS